MVRAMSTSAGQGRSEERDQRVVVVAREFHVNEGGHLPTTGSGKHPYAQSAPRLPKRSSRILDPGSRSLDPGSWITDGPGPGPGPAQRARHTCMGLEVKPGSTSLAWVYKTSARKVDKKPTLNSAPARSVIKKGGPARVPAGCRG